MRPIAYNQIYHLSNEPVDGSNSAKKLWKQQAYICYIGSHAIWFKDGCQLYSPYQGELKNKYMLYCSDRPFVFGFDAYSLVWKQLYTKVLGIVNNIYFLWFSLNKTFILNYHVL